MGGLVIGRRKKTAGAVLLAVFAIGCADETAIMVHVCFEPGVRAELTHVCLIVRGESRSALGHVFPLPAGGSTIDYSVRPGVELSGREEIVLTVQGLADVAGVATPRISRTVRTWFEPGADRDVAVTLEASCLDFPCADPTNTCAEGTCLSVVEAAAPRCPGE